MSNFKAKSIDQTCRAKKKVDLFSTSSVRSFFLPFSAPNFQLGLCQTASRQCHPFAKCCASRSRRAHGCAVVASSWKFKSVFSFGTVKTSIQPCVFFFGCFSSIAPNLSSFWFQVLKFALSLHFTVEPPAIFFHQGLQLLTWKWRVDMLIWV